MLLLKAVFAKIVVFRLEFIYFPKKRPKIKLKSFQYQILTISEKIRKDSK